MFLKKKMFTIHLQPEIFKIFFINRAYIFFLFYVKIKSMLPISYLYLRVCQSKTNSLNFQRFSKINVHAYSDYITRTSKASSILTNQSSKFINGVSFWLPVKPPTRTTTYNSYYLNACGALVIKILLLVISEIWLSQNHLLALFSNSQNPFVDHKRNKNVIQQLLSLTEKLMKMKSWSYF